MTVTFQVTGGSAIAGQDYFVSGNQVTLKKGESKAPLPIMIRDDSVPEPSETFTVSLGQVSGGGVLGTITQTNVVILVSDDPNGAFGKDYCKFPKFLDAIKLCCNLPKIQTKKPNHRVFHQ